MIDHKQRILNDHANRVKAYEWRDRTITHLMRRLEPLGPSDKIALLRRIDEVLAK